MAIDANINRIKFLRSGTAGAKPTTSLITAGEIAINYTDRTIYTTDGTNIIDLGFGLGGTVNGNIITNGSLSTTGNILSTGTTAATGGLGVNHNAGAGVGLSLYGGYITQVGIPSYGMAFALTSTFGNHGDVSGDYATYFTTTSGSKRGWIFKYLNGSATATNVASISADGVATFARVVGPLTGNADTTTRLQTARTINTVSFDGTSNISTPATQDVLSSDLRVLKPNNVTNKALGVYFTTSGGLVSTANTTYGDFLSLNTYGDATGGRVNGLFFNKGSMSIQHYLADFGASTWGTPKTIAYIDSDSTGNSATATKLQTARTINNVAFDGTANISVNANYSEVIPASADLNNYRTPGLYYCPSDADAKTQSNLPYASAYSLFIERSAGWKQTFTAYDSNRTWIRRFYNTAWTAWRELAFLNPSDQTFTENINLAKTSGVAQVVVQTADASTAQLTLGNSARTIALAVNATSGDLTIWDAKNSKTIVNFATDGNTSTLNQYLNIVTPLGVNNVQGTTTFSVTGGESSPLRFKINKAGSITTNSPTSGTGAIMHALSFNWYATEWQIGNIRGGSTDTQGFGITKDATNLVWRHDGTTQYNYANYYGTGYLITTGNIQGANLITTTGMISAPTSTAHYIDIGKDGSDRTIFGQYGGVYRFYNTSSNTDIMVINPSTVSLASSQFQTRQGTYTDTLANLGTGSTAAILVPSIAAPLNATGYVPFIHGSVSTVSSGYVTQVSIGAWRGSNTWSSSGAYIAIGGSDSRPVEDFRFMSGGWLGTSGGQLNILGTLYSPTFSAGSMSASTLTTTNGIAVGTTLSVTGVTYLAGTSVSGTLSVNNAATFSSTVSISGSLTITNGQLFTSNPQMQILTGSGSARGLAAGGLLSSDSYSDWSKVPTNGIYSKGDITSATWMYAQRYMINGEDGLQINASGYMTLSNTNRALSLRCSDASAALLTDPNGTYNILSTKNAVSTLDATYLRNSGNNTYNGQLTAVSGFVTTYGMWTSSLAATGSITCQSLTASGDVTAFSDKRLKENIKAIDNPITRLNKLNGVTYTRNDVDDKETRHVGLIAQDVFAAMPEAVKIADDEMNTMSVNYQGLVGLLVETIKDLNNRLEKLENK